MTITTLFVIAAVFCVGAALPLEAAQDLARIGFSTSELMVLFLSDAVLTVLVIAMLIWLLLRLIRPEYQPRMGRTFEIPDEPARQQLPGPPHSVGSVTEHTTRTLERNRYDTPRSLG
jgi:hypothetical protein